MLAVACLTIPANASVGASNPTAAPSPAASRSLPAPQPGRIGPAEWARLALERCHAAATRTRAADESLGRRLASLPAAREESSFLTGEAAARARVAESGRQAALSRMNALLFGSDARFPRSGSDEDDSFLDVLEGLLGRGDVCALEAVEATVLFGFFGIPFDAEAARHARPDRQFRVLEARLRHHLDNRDTPGQIFQRLRPPSPDDMPAFVEAITREAIAASNGSDTALERRPDVDRRLPQLLEFLKYSAEPVRIQSYLHARVDEVEGALGTVLPDGADDDLFRRVEDALYSSVDRMRRLREMPPEAVLAAIEPIVDRWFRSIALPGVRRSLERRPFGAYWFFVQSGGVAAPGAVFPGSRVEVHRPAFALSEIAVLPLAGAVARIRDARVPAEYLEHFRSLESAFTELTLSRDEVLARIDRIRAPAAVAGKLRAFMLTGAMPSRTSSLDVYSRLIRDASRIRGRVDGQIVAAAIEVFTTAKSERLDGEIDRILAGRPVDARLEGYLRTVAALMLELERRQATESAFQQGTAGAAIGWLLSRFFIGGTMPIALWAPQGVSGPEFAELVDEVAPRNRTSGNDYRGKPVSDITLVHDGREYHAALLSVIDSSRHFLNISAFDWKTDTGGRDIAYRLMAKKLGIDGAAYSRFLAEFERGLPMDPAKPAVVALYDIPTTRAKDLLVTWFFLTSDHPDVVRARDAVRDAGGTLACSTVMTCGDLIALRQQTGERYNRRAQTAASDRAWRAYQQIDALFAERVPALDQLRPRRALRDYCEDAGALRRFVRRVGLRRADRPGEPFPINIAADAKQIFSNVRMGERSPQFPYFFMEPIRDIYFMLLEFDIRLVLWKGPMEYPWHVGPVPIPGRKIFGIIPMPFIPYPWLNHLWGFGWAGPITSVLLQYVLASDVRIWWATVNHAKSWSNETVALESGMGMGSKYYNAYDEHRTWHDVGVLVGGEPVGDVNDYFVQVFNEARMNNAGLPGSLGVRIPRLRYEDYQLAERPAGPVAAGQAWLLTTHPEQGDSNYRGVFVAALAAARRNIYIENPFFSDPLIARMLIHKAREFRGRVSCAGLDSHACAERTRDAVQIHLVVPDSSDKPVVDAVGVADFHEMLHLGIKVHRWQPEHGWSASRMLHSKVWLIDHEPGRGGLAYVGAANVTQRSHLADNEAGILSNDPGFADQVFERVFRPDITTDSRLESGEGFHVVWSSSAIVRASRWLRRLLVDLFWFI